MNFIVSNASFFSFLDKNVLRKVTAAQQLESEKSSMLARGLNPHLEFRTKEVAEQVRKNVLCF